MAVKGNYLGAYLALLALVGMGRLIELVVSNRNQRKLELQGVRQIPERHFKWLVGLHATILIAAAVEVLTLHRPLIPALAISMGLLFVFSNLLRWWVIRILREHWTVKTMASSHLGIVTSGPYKWVRHPNYVGVLIEVFSLPMIHTAWITAIYGTLAYLGVLRYRLPIEDGVLFADAHYRETMGSKPGFLPKLL